MVWLTLLTPRTVYCGIKVMNCHRLGTWQISYLHKSSSFRLVP